MENIELSEKEKGFLEQVQSKIDKAYEEVRKGMVNTESFEKKFDEIQKSFDDLKNNAASKDVETAIKNISTDIAALKDRSEAKPIASDEFRKSLTDAAAALQKQRSGFVRVETPALIKTAGNMTTAVNVSGQIPQADREAGITQQLRRSFTIRNRSNVFPVSSTLAEWVEQRNRDGAAAMTAEGGTKPKIDWDYFTASTIVENLPAIVKISKQLLNDIPGMQGEINSELLYAIDLTEETQFLTGNGSTPNLKGIDSYAQSLDLASLQYTIPYPNYADCIAAVITQIKTNTLLNLYPTFILMHPVDVFTMINSTKNTQKNYLNPVTLAINPLAQMPNAFVCGVPVIETVSVAQGTFYVCDGTRFNIRDYETLNIELGYENDDFTKNFITVRGEKRLATYIKAQHVEGFVKSTFAAAMTFIDKAGS
jgi:HK97 family phage major capsid protein